MPNLPNVAIVGVGLIGGSVGMALKQRGLAREVIGVGRRQSSIDKALACGAVDHATTVLDDGVVAADVVVVATPVASLVEDVCQVIASAPAEALVTDVGSTKAVICAEVATRSASAGRFVGSHPLAGDHRTGPENARGDLLDGKTVVVTPTDANSESLVERATEFWEALGSTVVLMPPEAHDKALAATSHLPHLVASALAACTPEKWLSLAATGWSDTTRVAAANPELWTSIFAQNRAAVAASVSEMIAKLEQLQQALEEQDWSQIKHTLKQAKQIRDALGN